MQQEFLKFSAETDFAQVGGGGEGEGGEGGGEGGEGEGEGPHNHYGCAR